MARQWETQADLDRETAVARLYAELRDCAYEKLPVQYKADYAFLRDGELKALVEIRCRNVRHDQYDTIMLSLLKWHDVNAMAKAINVPAMFVVRYTDGIYSIPLRETPDEITMGGRALMRDARDREPVVHYRVDRMRFVADLDAGCRETFDKGDRNGG